MRHLRNLVILAFFSACWPAWAAAAGPSTAELLGCIKVPDDAARLKCFDREAGALAAAQTRAPSPSAAGRTAAPAPAAAGTAEAPKLTPEQKMGLTRDKVDAMETAPGAAPEPELKDFAAVIKSVSHDANNRLIVVLDNGQVWHQTERKVDFHVKPGETVHVMRAALGSYWLSNNPHAATRVARVR